VLLALGVALVAMLVAGCGSSSPSTSPTTEATSAPASTAPATTAPAGPTVGFPTNDAAAQHLLDAWRTHDRAAALQSATANAATTMLAVPVGQLNTRGCDAGEFTTSSCVYRLLTNQYEIRIDLEKRPIGWVVTNVQYSPPTP
jgi:hypothetical protein